ncbi:MAG: hypothetical protein AB2A00_30700 [Myxococcota bacterium]
MAFLDETYLDVPVRSGVFELEIKPTSGSLAALLRQHPGAMIEISVDGDPLSTEPLASSPFALYCGHADSADNALQLNGVPASELVRKADLSDGDASTSPVSWQDLVSLPSGCPEGQFVVGIDGTAGALECAVPAGGGDITAVSAGTGLIGGGQGGDVSLGVDLVVVQARVDQGCPADSAIRAVLSDGNVECEPVSATLLPDSVTAAHLASDSVGADELADDAVGPRSIAQGAITRAHLTQEDCAIGQAWVYDETGWVCADVNPITAGPGITLSGGVVSLDTMPPQIARTNLLSSFATGSFVASAITVTADGLPLVAFFQNVPNFDLRVLKCHDTGCATGQVHTLDTEDAGYYLSMVTPPDGLPVIIYGRAVAGSLHLHAAKCVTPECSAVTTNVLFTQGTIAFTTTALGTDGLPILSFYDEAAGSLSIAKCSDVSCTAAAVRSLTTSFTIGSTSIAVGPDGRPAVAFYDVNAGDLRLAACTSSDCSGVATFNTVDTTGDVGHGVSMTVGNDGRLIMAYADVGNGALKVAKCADATCSSSTKYTVDTGQVGTSSSITMFDDGLPLIAYQDYGNDDLKTAKCTTPDCANSVITRIDSTGDVGSFTAASLGLDGTPVVAYRDVTNQSLKLVKCANRFCVSNWARR